MKTKKILPLVLCAALSFTLVACGAASQPTDGGASVVNPLVDVASLEDLNKQVGVKIALPDTAKDASFHVLDKDIAQINFTVDGVSYVLRATLSAEDIAGVYGDSKDIGTFTAEANGKTTEVTVTSTTDCGVFRFAWDKTFYTLVANGEVKDINVLAGSGKVALDCATVCASSI